jgi:thioredoxin-dependent peroxiredoxin
LSAPNKDFIVVMTLVLAALMQQPAAPPAPQSPPALEVGAVAPDFAIPGATRYGTLKNPVRLSDFKGKTVVLAFFFKARTRG